MIIYTGTRTKGGEPTYSRFACDSRCRPRESQLPLYSHHIDFLNSKTQLAFGLLIDAMYYSSQASATEVRDTAELLAPEFANEVVAHFPAHGWSIWDWQILDWVASKNIDDKCKGV